jgi:hypothetical protein
MDALEPTESKAMNINLTPEQEKIVKDKLKSGRFRTVEEVIEYFAVTAFIISGVVSPSVEAR